MFIPDCNFILASRGNLTEHTVSATFALLMLGPAIVLVIYFILWQVYVLRADIVLSGILLSMQGVELLFTVIALCTFSR